MKPDVIIVGAGPGGLSAATILARAGANVQLIDEQPYAGGQVYRASEKVAAGPPGLRDWLGEDYLRGHDLIKDARDEANIEWRFDTSVWDISCQEASVRIATLHREQTTVVEASHVILATGAMERPTPFSGWTLPGVMGVGAAQTLLKDSTLMPDDEVVLAGSGPLLYLYANQLLNAGIRPAAILDTGGKSVAFIHWWQLTRAARHHIGQLAKGLGWRNRIARSGVTHVFGVEQLQAVGDGKVQAVRYHQSGRWHDIATPLLLVHDGVVPNTHLTMAARCEHDWQPQQAYWQPRLDSHGQTSQQNLWVAGDGAGILGAEAAAIQGRVLGRHLAIRLGLTGGGPFDQASGTDRRALEKLIELRRFLDAQYAPAPAFAQPEDDIIVCRCEAIQAGEIRDLARLGCTGPNQARAFTRAGMGPCMGRQCSTMVSRLLATNLGTTVQGVGHYSVRPPVKPISVAQLANLNKQ